MPSDFAPGLQIPVWTMRTPSQAISAAASRPVCSAVCARCAVGLPAVADLPRPIFRVPAGHPVHLVRADAGLVASREEGLESLPELGDRLLVDESLFDDDEAVALERVELLRAPLFDRHARGRRFSGS
jgi:hypothetical protein